MPAPTATSPIDAVDDLDNTVGTVARGDVLRLGLNFRTVHVFVFDRDGLLLQQLGALRLRYPHRWGSSVAAYLHAGETYEHAASRRTAEELGLHGDLRLIGKTMMEDVRSAKFIELFTLDSDSASNRAPDQIESLRYWPCQQIDKCIDCDPTLFTPTFLHLYRFFRLRQKTRLT